MCQTQVLLIVYYSHHLVCTALALYFGNYYFKDNRNFTAVNILFIRVEENRLYIINKHFKR